MAAECVDFNRPKCTTKKAFYSLFKVSRERYCKVFGSASRKVFSRQLPFFFKFLFPFFSWMIYLTPLKVRQNHAPIKPYPLVKWHGRRSSWNVGVGTAFHESKPDAFLSSNFWWNFPKFLTAITCCVPSQIRQTLGRLVTNLIKIHHSFRWSKSKQDFYDKWHIPFYHMDHGNL